MTLEEAPEFFENLRARIIEAATERAIPAAANTMAAEMKERIFSLGKAADGGDIGQYSAKAGYFVRSQFIRQGAFKPIGKNGDVKKENGTQRKSMFLKGGYKELREIQGRQTNKKDFRYSGSGERSIKVVHEEKRTLIAITDEKESKKLRGAEKQSGKIVFVAAETEIELFRDTAVDLLKQEFGTK
jgi:hypothetical protein